MPWQHESFPTILKKVFYLKKTFEIMKRGDSDEKYMTKNIQSRNNALGLVFLVFFVCLFVF